ncbi:MAG TPA: glycosyltransferase family 4 protein [Thermoplasmata archaeon]|nr:glycosyltransferase family 4 protein [Thermoplasmata archaeon]
MRVCLLTPEFLPSWGGIGTYTYYLARGLRDHAEVHVVTSDAGVRMDRLPGLDRLHVHPLPTGGQGREGASSLRFQMAVWRHLPRLVRDGGFDIVHSNHAQMADVLARLRSMDTSPVVTVHTTLDSQMAGTLQASPVAEPQETERTVVRHRNLLRIVERRYLKRSPSLIFVSRWIRDQAVNKYRLRPANSRVIPNAVDTEMFSPYGWPAPPAADETAEETDRPFTLLYAGRLLAQKGLGTLLSAIPRMPRSVRVTIAGPGDPAPWKEFAASHGIPTHRVSFLGRVDYARMPDLYRSADAVVLPSFLESCPLTGLEAMACGTPLIAADVGGVSEIVRDGDTGWLFRAGDAAALAARVASVAEGGPQVRRVIFAARRWIETNATVERMADETLQLYRAALKEGNT